METKFTLTGVDKIEEFFGQLPKTVLAAVHDVAITMRNLAVGRSPYLTGAFKGDWESVVPLNEGGFSFENPSDYGDILEEGLYQRVGPRTVSYEGGIYSKQAPGGILTPLIEDDAVIERATSYIIDVIERIVPNA